MCGGLGPTQDDITREAIAEVMNVPLVRDGAVVARIEGFFAGRGRDDVRQQPPPGRRAGGSVGHRAGPRHRTRPDLSDRPQGRLHGARRAVRDGRDVRASDPARPAGPDGRGRGGGGHRQPGPPHVGDERVRVGRSSPGPHRHARPRRGHGWRRHDRLPGQRDRRDQGATRPPEPPPPARSWRGSTPKRPKFGRRWPIDSATSSSASTTRRWKKPSARSCSTVV